MSRELPFFLMGKIFLPEGNVLHGESLAPQVVQHPRVGGKIEVQLVGIEGLAGLVIPLVHVAPAVLAVPQQGSADFRHGDTDLMGPAGQQAAFHQR